MDLAMEATSWYLKCSGQHLIDIDLEEFDDLTPLVERKLVSSCYPWHRRRNSLQCMQCMPC